jgi:hypothetical protein
MDLIQKITVCDGSSEQLDDIKRSVAELAASCSQHEVSLGANAQFVVAFLFLFLFFSSFSSIGLTHRDAFSFSRFFDVYVLIQTGNVPPGRTDRKHTRGVSGSRGAIDFEDYRCGFPTC